MDPLLSLTAASLAFLGTHFALSHPLRAPLVGAVGASGFQGLYSLVAAACMIWMYFAFTASPGGDLGGSGEIGWILATVLTLPAIVLLLGSFRGNPALAAPGAKEAAQREPTGVFAVTRHPMMWGFALWAVSHIILWWSWRTMIVALTILVLALVGAKLQDRKKQLLMGEAWAKWEAKTTYRPRWSKLPGAGPVLWLLAVAGWIALSWVHIPSGGIPAGIWRWL